MAARKKTNAKVDLGPMRTDDEVREAMDKVGSLPADNKLSDVSPEQIAKLSGALAAQREPPLTMDDLAARHAAPEESLPHGFRIVPPELPPERRDGPTMGPVKMIYDDPPDAPDESDERIRSLEDLMARFPFNRARQDYFIRVNRTAPKTYLGMTVTGVLRKIVEPLTYEQFVELYGGGDYDLTVYGPPRRGGIMDPATGKMRQKALTRPISFTVPFDKEGVFGIAPNPSASIPEVDEAYPMESPNMQKVNMPDDVPHPFQRSMRISTPADASIHKSDLEFRRDKEREERERADREEERRLSEREVEMQLKLEEMRMRERQEARTVEISQEQARAERAQREELQRQIATGGGSVTEILRAVGVFKDDSSVKVEMVRQAEAHKTEVTRLMEAHKDELSRREDEHRKDLERERSLADEKLRMARDEANRDRERTEKLARDVEERADRRAKDAEDRAERRVEETRRDYERQLEAQKSIFESRLADERRNNERDLASRKDSHDSRLQTEKVSYDLQVKSLEREVAQLRAEESRLRTELESKGDVVAQVQKVTEVANALGFTKAGEVDNEKDEDEGPKDWKSLASAIGMNLVQNLPQMVRAAGDAVQAIRGQRDTTAAAAAASSPYPAEAPVTGPQPAGARYGFKPRQRLNFATGDGELPGVNDYTPMLASPPIYPTVQQPMPPPPLPPPPMAPQPTMVSTPPMAPSVAPPPPVMPSAPPPPTAAPAANPAASQTEEQEIAAQILMFRPVLEQAVVNDADPVREVKQMVEQFGPEMVRTIASTITADRIIAVVSQAPDAASSPLLKFAGKKWLRAFEAAARAV